MPEWESIVNEHGPVVWRTTYRLLNHHADACDCFQEVFLEALELSRREEVRNWPGLLRKVATRRALDRLRKRHCAASQHQSLERSPEPASANPGPVEHAEMNELISRLRQGVAKLPAMQADVFCLRCFEEMSYQEIAEELGIEPNSVGVLLHRARGQVGEWLKEAHDE